jgi:hypothetical protein
MNHLNILLILSLIICIGTIMLSLKSKGEHYAIYKRDEKCVKDFFKECGVDINNPTLDEFVRSKQDKCLNHLSEKCPSIKISDE